MHPCCCHPPGSSGSSVAPPDCLVCLPGTSPERYQIDVQGMRNRFAILCADCPHLDGSYIVQRLASCYYGVDFPPVCGYSRIELLVAATAYYVTFILGGGVPGALDYQRVAMPFPRDCREHALPIFPVGFLGNCDHMASTCKITAL